MNKITWKMCEYMVIDESDEERERERNMLWENGCNGVKINY